MSGSADRRALRRGSSSASKMLSVIMALVLAIGLMPLPAFAADDPAAGDSTANAEEPAGSGQGGEAPVVDSGNADEGGKTDAEGAQVDGSAESEGTDSPAGDAGDESEDGEGAASAADSGTGDPALPAASSMMRTQTVGDEGGVGDRALSEDAFLLIQDEKDAASSWDYVSGSVSSGMTLWANMYDSAGYSDTPVPAEDGWTYQWYACDTDSNDLDDYAAIDGQTSQSLVLTDDLCEQLAGKYLAVAAMADGVRHIGPASSYTAKNGLLNANYLPGPVKRAGEVEIYSVVIQNQADGSSVFRVGDTAVAKAREKGAASGEYIDADLLEFQWRGSDTKSGGYEDIENATSETLPIDESLEGKYLQCVVSSKVGSSTYERSTTLPVGAQDAVNITSITLDRTGKVNVGDVITATAKAGSEDATASEKVVWSWYCGDSSYSTDAKIDGADSNELTVTDDLEGKYIEARADGGFGVRDSSAAGPVVEPGAVELYQITVEGEAKIDSTLTATAYKENAYTEVDSSDKVTYQWQYADSKTTSDSAFKDIDGADGRTYVIDQSMAGKYLRVTATSDGTVVSTKKPSYYGSTYVDPLGPVTLAGQYTLADVELESSGQAGQAGNTITPTAMVEGSSSWMTSPAPSDAKLTFVWEYEAGDGSWKSLEAGYDPSNGVLVLSDDLVGKTLRVKASALDNEVESGSFAVIPSGTYDLLRMTTSPSIDGSNTNLLTGDSIDATVQAKRLDEGSYAGDVVSEGFSIKWYAGDARDGDYSEIEGADDVRLVIPEEAAGKYLKAVATSGSSSVEIVSANPVLDGDSLGAAVVGLEDGNWRPEPVYGVDSNMNDLVEAELASLGFDDVEVTTVDAGVSDNLPEGATVDVSVAEGEGNGDITYFFMDPDDLTGWVGFSTYRTIKPTFKLTRDGETVEFTPSRTTSMPWDEAKVAQMLSEDADECLAIEYAAGDSAESVTQDMTLPYKLADVSGGERSWSKVTWTSSNEDAVKITGYSWEDYEGNITRAAADQQVTLTATIGVSSSGGPETTVQKEFSITVKGDPDKVAAEQEELQKKVEAAFDASKLTYSEDGAAIDPDAVTGDIQLPTTRALGIDGKDYSVEYSASNDSIVVNGYRANVYRPLPTQRGAETVELTVTVASKANAQISATKTISLAVAPLEAEDIRSELSLMDQAKEGYAAALLNGQDAQDVTVDLATFKKAYFAADGSLAWARTADEADEAGDGIETADLEPDDEMGAIQGHWFKSSDPGVIAHDTLLVAQPEYNTQVTVTSALSSEKYARYAERYADDPVWGEAFSQLANQPVSATFTVAGTTGQDAPAPDPDSEIKVTGAIIGADDKGGIQWWGPTDSFEVEAGTTAEDLTLAMFDRLGLETSYSYTEYGLYLETVTSPFDDSLTLGYDEATGKYWQLFVNGAPASAGAGSIVLQEGDSVAWYYSSRDQTALPEEGMIAVSAEIIGRDADGSPQTWAQPVSLTVPEGSTAAVLSEELFKQAGIAADVEGDSYGWYLNSITSPFDESVILSSEEVSSGVWAYWQFFVNGAYSADAGASAYVLEPGDSISWVYGSDGTMPGQIAVSASIVGQDASGATQTWVDETGCIVLEGTTAAELTELMFKDEGISADYGMGDYGWSLNSITSPFDADLTLSMSQDASGNWLYWQLFMNGASSADGAGLVELEAGDAVIWYYSAYGSDLPDPDDVVVDPDAPRPDYDSSWPTFAGTSAGAVTSAPTPTQAASSAWEYEYGTDQGASDPLIVNGDVYLVSGSKLMKIDGETGHAETANLGSSISFFCRPAYADGLIIVPTDGGILTAFTADALTPVWRVQVPGATEACQALSSVTVANGRAYVAFTVSGGAWSTGTEGVLACISIEDGTVVWSNALKTSETGAPEGYYWSGAVASGDDIVIGNEAGKVALIDGATGKELSSVSIGASCRSTVVASADDPGILLAVSRDDGALHKIVREGDSLRVAGSVSFAEESTSTPAIAGGKAYVCGTDAEGYGTLSIIDIASMKVEKTVRGGKGAAQSSPLVSVQPGGTYVYFTCNTLPGCVYGYRVGDDSAYVLYTPEDKYQQYCTASVVCDELGNLYYTNDAGVLFKLNGREGAFVTFDSRGGSEVASAYVAIGDPVAKPADPVREGYSFTGWFADEACTQAWDFADAVQGAMTLYAGWEEASSSNPSQGSGSGGTGSSPLILTRGPAAGQGADQAAAGAVGSDAAKAESGSASASARAMAIGADETAGVVLQSGMPSWLPVAGIAVGACGLIAALVWALLLVRRRSDGEGDAR